VTLIGGCTRNGPTRGPVKGILLIVVDALRPDHLGAYGYPRSTSPTLDRLAAEGIVFEAAFSPCGWTRPSIASMFTGLYPSEHGLRERARRKNQRFFLTRLDQSLVTLAEILTDRGFDTLAVVANPHLGLGQGFEQGFSDYFDNDRSAAEILDRFIAWREEKKPAPFFAYLHFMDVHWPYQPPAPYDRKFDSPGSSIDFAGLDWNLFRRQIRSGDIRLSPEDLAAVQALYDGQIRYLDDQLASALDRIGEDASSWLILITADHGEEFLEHGGMGHGPFLYDVHTRVPWILRLPHGYAGRGTVPWPVSTVDIMPTLVELAGGSMTGTGGGVSRLDLIDGAELPKRSVVFGEEHYEDLYYRHSVRSDRFKFIRTTVRGGSDGLEKQTRFELYDLAADPLEQRNLIGESPAVARDMAARLEQHLSNMQNPFSTETGDVPLRPEAIEELRSLGYLE
jgi:arylsulfatase A-like enzyme